MIKVTSPAFDEGQHIPAKYTCEGEDVSPPLRWGNVPTDTRNIAIICDDPDAPGGTFTHWVLYGLPGTARELPEGIATQETLSFGSKQGASDFPGRVGYGGPCPPAGKTHHYYFHVYALDAALTLRPGATKEDLLSAMTGHVLAEGQLMGTYKK
jgi:Raf kinase inhibitor-like YbhB/YbcL family protein